MQRLENICPDVTHTLSGILASLLTSTRVAGSGTSLHKAPWEQVHLSRKWQTKCISKANAQEGGKPCSLGQYLRAESSPPSCSSQLSSTTCLTHQKSKDSQRIAKKIWATREQAKQGSPNVAASPFYLLS